MNSESRLFLEALFAGKPDNLQILLWTLPEKESRWFQGVEEAIRYAESMADRNLYVGVGLSTQDYGATKRCLSTDVAGIVGLWADFDLKSDAHPKQALPATTAEALKLLPDQFPPTFLIETGNGLHAWWLFREPWIFEGDADRGTAVNLVSRWQTLLRLNAAGYGWAFDRLLDLARVLRVPGTTNCKDPKNPKPVTIHSHTGQRYNPSELCDFLDHCAVPDADQQERDAQSWQEKISDKSLALSPDATVPPALLEQYLATDPKFTETWERRRADLRDQSGSGYDLALANFGAAAGWTEQQVVDLIIHHRRIHNQRPRTALDYFHRTISKAFSSNGVLPTKIIASAVGDADNQASQAKPDSPSARALLCEQISQALKIPVLRIVKISGQEPTYRVELDRAKVQFSCVANLVRQHTFRMGIVGAADILIPKFKPAVWERIVQTLLNALTVEDGGDEADLEGSARMYVERYLAEATFIDADEEQPYQSRSCPAIYEGKIAICSQERLQHINKTWAQNRAIKEVTAMLSVLGASTTRLKRTKLRDQSRWLLPADRFPPECCSDRRGEDL